MTFSVGIWFPAGQDHRNGEHFKVPDWGHCRITWTTISAEWDTNNESGRISMDHFSMLSNGWIPEDGLDFFAQFLDNLRERWLKVCNLAEQHLTDCVSPFTFLLECLSHSTESFRRCPDLIKPVASQAVAGKRPKPGAHKPPRPRCTNMDQSSQNVDRTRQYGAGVWSGVLRPSQWKPGPR
jgi:hypothetical protein